MSVPLFVLDDTIKGLYQDGIDTIISQLGQDCKIFLDGDRRPCPNCLFDPMTGRSSGTYNGSGPKPFAKPSPCPVCRGTGYDPSTLERVEIRRFTIDRTAKPPIVLPGNIKVAATATAVIKGFATDLPLVQAMKHVVLDYQNAKTLSEKYILLMEPTPTGSIVAGRYFEAWLRRDD